MSKVVEGTRCVLLCILETVEGCSEAGGAEAMRCVLLCTLEDVEGGLCLLEAPEGMRRVLLYFPLSSFRSSRLFGQPARGGLCHRRGSRSGPQITATARNTLELRL